MEVTLGAGGSGAEVPEEVARAMAAKVEGRTEAPLGVAAAATARLPAPTAVAAEAAVTVVASTVVVCVAAAGLEAVAKAVEVWEGEAAEKASGAGLLVAVAEAEAAEAPQQVPMAGPAATVK